MGGASVDRDDGAVGNAAPSLQVIVLVSFSSFLLASKCAEYNAAVPAIAEIRMEMHRDDHLRA